MPVLLLLASLATAAEERAVGPETGDFPSRRAGFDNPDQAGERIVIARTDWSRFGRLPVKRNFNGELAATTRDVALFLGPAELLSER